MFKQTHIIRILKLNHVVKGTNKREVENKTEMC